jgi:hypothetical protein
MTVISKAEKERRDALPYHEQMIDAQKQCVPCKLCGSDARIEDAGRGAGYYIRCSNAKNFRDSTGCLINDRRLGGWAYNVMDWWNRLHAPALETSNTSGAGIDREAVNVERAFLNLCEALGIQASAGAYLDAPAALAALKPPSPSDAGRDEELRASDGVMQSLRRIADSAGYPGDRRNMMIRPADANIILAALSNTQPQTPASDRAIVLEEAAFRAGFKAATVYDWDYAANGSEDELCDAATEKWLASSPPQAVEGQSD